MLNKAWAFLSGDLNSRVGECNDFIVNDDLSVTVFNNIANIIAYSNDLRCPVEIQRIKPVTILVENCLTCVKHQDRECATVDAGVRAVGLLFSISLGEALLITSLCTGIIMILCQFFKVLDFNIWSDHTPIEFNLRSLCNSIRSIDLDNSVSCSTHTIISGMMISLRICEVVLNNASLTCTNVLNLLKTQTRVLIVVLTDLHK